MRIDSDESFHSWMVWRGCAESCGECFSSPPISPNYTSQRYCEGVAERSEAAGELDVVRKHRERLTIQREFLLFYL